MRTLVCDNQAPLLFYNAEDPGTTRLSFDVLVVDTRIQRGPLRGLGCSSPNTPAHLLLQNVKMTRKHTYKLFYAVECALNEKYKQILLGLSKSKVRKLRAHHRNVHSHIKPRYCNPVSDADISIRSSFVPEATQSMIYHDVVGPMLDEVMMGYNCTLFANGQTGR